MEPVITGGACCIKICALGAVCTRWWRDEAKENLKEVLAPDEYESIFDSGKYEIKLKILDIFSDKTVSIFMLKKYIKRKYVMTNY